MCPNDALIDPIKSKWCVSLDLLACMPYACASSKGERVIVYKWLSVVHLVMCEVAIVLQSKSIKLFRDVATGPNLSLTTDHMFLVHVPWILVVSNDPDAGTALD